MQGRFPGLSLHTPRIATLASFQKAGRAPRDRLMAHVWVIYFTASPRRLTGWSSGTAGLPKKAALYTIRRP